jgi:hypothetical protein
MIVCPLESNSMVTTCCGPPVATAAAIPCCLPTAGTRSPAIACPVLGLTISAQPDPSTAGGRVTVSGRWVGGTAGQTISLWEKLPGQSRFRDVAHTATDSSGGYQFVRNEIKRNREWYVTSASGLRSVTVGQRVRVVVTLGVAGLRAHGRVTPGHAGERVLLEQRRLAPATGWAVIARPRLSASSRYSVKLPGSGQVEFRTVFPGDSRNIRSVSREFKVTA